MLKKWTKNWRRIEPDFWLENIHPTFTSLACYEKKQKNGKPYLPKLPIFGILGFYSRSVFFAPSWSPPPAPWLPSQQPVPLHFSPKPQTTGLKTKTKLLHEALIWPKCWRLPGTSLPHFACFGSLPGKQVFKACEPTCIP